MTTENARIECSAKPITHAFIHFKNDDERNQEHQVSEHVEKRTTRRKVEDIAINGRRRKISSEKNGIHVKHNVPLDSITTNRTLKHIAVKGQIVVKTCQSRSLKYIKYQDIETEVKGQMDKWQSKNSSQRLTKRRRKDYE